MDMTQQNLKRTIPTREYPTLLSEEDQRNMKKLFSTAANKSAAWLALHMHKIEQIRDTIYHVHPLTFIERVFLDESLKDDLRKVYAKGFIIWGAFTRNIKWPLEQEMKRNNVFEHVSEFSKKIQLPEDKVTKFLKAKDVSGLFCEAIH